MKSVIASTLILGCLFVILESLTTKTIPIENAVIIVLFLLPLAAFVMKIEVIVEFIKKIIKKH